MAKDYWLYPGFYSLMAAIQLLAIMVLKMSFQYIVQKSRVQ